MPNDIPLGGGSPSQRLQLNDRMRLRGGSRRPTPPCSIIAQPGAGKILLSWQIPSDPANIACVTRIFLDRESCLIQTVASGQTQTQIPMSAGANPPVRGLFLSLMTPAGAESRKVFITGHALADASTVSDPPPSGGDDLPRGRYCFSGNTLIVTRAGSRAIQDVRVGDHVLTAAGLYLPIAKVHRHEGFSGMLRDVVMGLVTEEHLVLDGDAWKPAGQVYPDREPYKGTLFNLSIATNEPIEEALSPKTERSYVLANGIKAHNLKPLGG